MATTIKIKWENRHLDPAMRQVEDRFSNQIAGTLPVAISEAIRWLKRRIRDTGTVNLQKASKPSGKGEGATDEPPVEPVQLELPWFVPTWQDYDELDALLRAAIYGNGVQVRAAQEHAEAVHRIAAVKASGDYRPNLPASEVISRAYELRLGDVDRRAIDFSTAYDLHEIRGQNEKAIGAIRENLLLGIKRTQHPDVIGHRLKLHLEDFNTDFRRIAITETARSFADGTYVALAGDGDDLCFVGAAGEGFHTGPHGAHITIEPCEQCKAKLENRVFRIADLREASNYGVRQANWKAAIPMHPNCRHGPQRATRWIREQVGGRNVPPEGLRIAYVPPALR